ncbi:hypothetical protein ACHELS_001767 [Vibrio vulnificus]|uniref:hypothetical protein n=1 Tax=Vibrio parahaemolyticus TaxID=670 RepID=UPI001B810B93|nr:hypothetical protein [Vibrio parahaemolyticus]MDF4684664.1 hypothetical protein [Vibrio parahaemolyticus]HBC3990498.1 hypothetical protein [Vibrio parahaemolyticus]
MKNELKVWGGRLGIAMVLAGAVSVYILADQTQDMQGLQYLGNECFRTKDAQTCSELINFGVSSEMYLNDENYRKNIDKKAIKILENAPIYAADIAEFTLENAGSKGVKLSAEILKELNEMKDSK